VNNLIFNDGKEVTVPEQKETFEAQVLVISQPYKKTVYPHMISNDYYPLSATRRVLETKHYSVELIMPVFPGGKPTLIIREDAASNE